MKNKHVYEPCVKICAIWLFIANRRENGAYGKGVDRIDTKFWSSLFNCTETSLSFMIKKVKELSEGNSKTTEDEPFLFMMYEELKDLPSNGIKKIMKTIYKEEKGKMQ